MSYKITVENEDGELLFEEFTTCVLLSVTHIKRNEKIEEEGGKVVSATVRAYCTNKGELAAAVQAVFDDEDIKKIVGNVQTIKM
jgi:hypothetical protein